MIPKFPRIAHLPFSPEIHSDDKTHPTPARFLNVDVVITEKMDGGNTGLSAGTAYARSTGQPARHGSFDIIKARYAPKTLGDARCFYGENMYGVHSIEYERLTEFFYLFAIRDGDRWQSWDATCGIAAALGFATVPVVCIRQFTSLPALQAFLAVEIAKPSFFGSTREGLTIRLRREFDASEFADSYAKYVRRGHVQTDEHWTVNWKPATLGAH